MVSHLYQNKIRVRANGLLVKDNAVLLVQLYSPVTEELIWTPPGGGLEFGETLEACLRREFIEETGLEVEVNGLVFVNELVKPPFHAVEFYFGVSQTGGVLKLGTDPEHQGEEQYLQDVKWIELDTLDQVNLAPSGLAETLKNNSDAIQGSFRNINIHKGY